MKNTLLFLMTLLVFLPGKARLNEENENLAMEVQQLCSNFSEISQARLEHIDSLRNIQSNLESSLERVELTQQIANLYKDSDINLAMLYWSLAQKEAQSLSLMDKELELGMIYLSHYPLLGPGIEVVKAFDQINPMALDIAMKKIYWISATRLNYYIQARFPDGPQKMYYRQRTINAYDSLTRYSPLESVITRLVSARLSYLTGEEALSIAAMQEIAPFLDESSEDYEEALRTLASYYAGKPQHRQLYIKHLLEHTSVTMRRGVIRPEILAETGNVLCEEGKGRLGERLIFMAMSYQDNRAAYNKSFNYTKYVNYISGRISSIRLTMVIVLFVILLLVALFAFLLLNKVRKTRKSLDDYKCRERTLQNKVVDLERVTIGCHSLSFIFQEQLSEYNLYVLRKLKSGQAKDLYSDIEHGSYMEAQREKFFVAFDELVLSLFPDFVDRLNTLMLPDKGFSLIENHRLSHELRIAAYLRFGIKDSAKLAGLFGLSVNSIYTYRNRLKSRAVDKENLEENIKNLYI